jgi:hypothetical protein
VPPDCASGSVSGAKPSKTTRRLSITREEEGAGAMMSAPLVNDSSQTAARFQFPLLFYYMDRHLLPLQPSSPSSTSIVIANFIPHHLQLQLSSPSTSILVAKFIPHHQLQPSSPSTSTLVAFQFPNPVAFLFPPLLIDAHCVLDAATTR